MDWSPRLMRRFAAGVLSLPDERETPEELQDVVRLEPVPARLWEAAAERRHFVAIRWSPIFRLLALLIKRRLRAALELWVDFDTGIFYSGSDFEGDLRR